LCWHEQPVRAMSRRSPDLRQTPAVDTNARFTTRSNARYQFRVQRTEYPRSGDPNAPSNRPTHEPSSPRQSPYRVFRGEFRCGPGRLPPAQTLATRNGNKNIAGRRAKTHIRISNLLRHYTVSFKGNSRIGGKRCPVGSSAEVAVTKPNLPDRSNNLELEAATKAIAPDKLRQHGVLSWLADFSTLDYIS
jgi:hypothetical protein